MTCLFRMLFPPPLSDSKIITLESKLWELGMWNVWNKRGKKQLPVAWKGEMAAFVCAGQQLWGGKAEEGHEHNERQWEKLRNVSLAENQGSMSTNTTGHAHAVSTTGWTACFLYHIWVENTYTHTLIKHGSGYVMLVRAVRYVGTCWAKRQRGHAKA